MQDPIKVEGLAEFSRSLKRLDSSLPKALRIALNQAADVVVREALPRIPKRTGRAKSTVKAMSTRTASRVSGGSKRAPYYPWLDFGGRVGRNRSVERPFYKSGRYIYQAYYDKTDEVQAALTGALVDVARQAGLEVDSGG